MRNTLLILMILFTCSMLFGQEKKRVVVEFEKEGKKVNLEKGFEIFFVFPTESGKTIMHPKINENSFESPELCGNKEGYIIFVFKNKACSFFSNIPRFDQDWKWVFGIDKKPYVEDLYTDSSNGEKVKGVVYLKFIPQEMGDGTVHYIRIVNYKKYFAGTMALIEE